MKSKSLLLFLILSLVVFSVVLSNKNKSRKNKFENKPKKENMIQAGNENIREIYLAGGCFWGLEAYMERIEQGFIILILKIKKLFYRKLKKSRKNIQIKSKLKFSL